jgi:hypothetical protein
MAVPSAQRAIGPEFPLARASQQQSPTSSASRSAPSPGGSGPRRACRIASRRSGSSLSAGRRDSAAYLIAAAASSDTTVKSSSSRPMRADASSMLSWHPQMLSMGSFSVEVSVRPCGQPLGLEAATRTSRSRQARSLRPPHRFRQPAVMTPHAIRAPLFPVGSVTPSSLAAWMISALPLGSNTLSEPVDRVAWSVLPFR